MDHVHCWHGRTCCWCTIADALDAKAGEAPPLAEYLNLPEKE